MEYKSLIQEMTPYALIYSANTKNPLKLIYVPSIRIPPISKGESVDTIIGYTDFDADQDTWLEKFMDSHDSKN